MGRRWKRRGAIAAALSVALHLLLLASGVPWSAPSETNALVSEVELVLRTDATRASNLREPPRPSTDSSRRLEAPLPPPDIVAPRSVEVPRIVDAPLEPEPPDPPVPLPPSPMPEPTVELPTIPTPREAARRRVALDVMPPPTEVALVTARVNALLEGYLPPPLNDTSPMPDLRPDGQGNLVHEDGALVATIRPDGSVVFGRNRGGSLDGLGKSPDPVEQEILDMHTRLPGVPLIVRKASEGDCAAGRCYDKAGLGLSFRPNSDLNDLILRAKGEDPLAAKKRRFLRLTEEIRDELASRYKEQTLARSKLRAGRHLERIWSDASLSFAAKRRTLFQLWDECDEPEGDGDERAEAAAGLRARGHILRFIRQHMPPGSPEAFTDGELRSLNAGRSSKRSFQPYR